MAVPAGGWTQLYGGVAVQMPPELPSWGPLKSVSGTAWAFQVKASAPGWAGGAPASPPRGDRYQERAVVPGMGNRENDCSNPGNGYPGVCPAWPAPLSNSTRIDGSFSNAASAPAYVGWAWIGSGGRVTPLMPIAD